MLIDSPILQIQIFQNLTFKIQGQGHGCGQKSQVTKWVWLCIDLHPFCSMLISPPIPGIWLFQNLLAGQGHSSKSHSGSNVLWTHIPFHPTLVDPPIPEIQLFHDLENSRSWSWERSKFKATKSVPFPIHSHPFHSAAISPPIPMIQHFFF